MNQKARVRVTLKRYVVLLLLAPGFARGYAPYPCRAIDGIVTHRSDDGSIELEPKVGYFGSSPTGIHHGEVLRPQSVPPHIYISAANIDSIETIDPNLPWFGTPPRSSE